MLSKQRGRPLSVPCFSSLNRMLRIVIRLQRLVKLCRKVRVGTGIFFSYQYYSDALLAVVKCSQAIFLKPLLQELSSGKIISYRPLTRLSSFIDSHSVIRVGGRLRHSLLSDRRKYPVLLSKSSHLSLLDIGISLLVMQILVPCQL
jgi:hypothetical protein